MTPLEPLLTRSPVKRRVLALLMLAGAIVFLWGTVLTPLGWIARSQDQWRRDVRRDLARERGKAALEPGLHQRLVILESDPIWGRFYEVPHGQDATAVIQRELVSTAAKAGVMIRTITPAPAVEENGLAGYGVRFSASLSADQLGRLVDALRTNAHYLRVERLTVTSPQLQRLDQNAALEVTMEVFGFTRRIDRRGVTPAPVRSETSS